MDLEVKTGALNTYAEKERGIKRQLDTLGTQLQSCRTQIRQSLTSSASGNIDRVLGNVHTRLGVSARKVNDMANALDTIANMYSTAERDISGSKPSGEEVKAPGGGRMAGGGGNASGMNPSEWGVVKFAKNATQRVVNKVTDIYKDLKESYDSHGAFYYVAEYGKAAVKAALAVSTIVASVAVIAGTGGIAAIPAAIAIIKATNDCWNAVSDVINITKGNYEQVGKTNLLKSAFEYTGGKIAGEKGVEIADYAFYGMDVVASACTLAVSLNGLSGLQGVNSAKLATEAKEIGNAVKATSVSSVFKTSVQNIKYNYALAKYAFPETGKLMKNAGILYKVGDSTKKTIENEYKFFNKGQKTDVFDGYNSVNNVYVKAKKLVKTINKIDTVYNDVVSCHAGA